MAESEFAFLEMAFFFSSFFVFDSKMKNYFFFGEKYMYHDIINSQTTFLEKTIGLIRL